ncbi:MAG: secondary thiamine-phosphate synthase enzyme YjbQ [Candidatus Omnitrophota bacterium]|nr:secondary thiamine-phosphate synthase enzyme YjbQ [Candidatus Omnitrophota bacterium]
MITTEYISLSSRGNTDVIDITPDCQAIVEASGTKNGIISVFNPGSTGGLTTIEYEPNLVKDLRNALEVIAPSDKTYEHSKTWHDDNGSSHIRSSLMGPSISVPFIEGELSLGTWQQIVFCDFDTRPRSRRLVVQVIGE